MQQAGTVRKNSGSAVPGKPGIPDKSDKSVKKAHRNWRGRAKKDRKNDDPNKIGFWGKGNVDIPMLILIFVLLIFGITMMFSAGHALSYRENGDSFAYTVKQMIAAGIGLAVMVFFCFFDYRWLRKERHLGRFKFTWAHIVFMLTIFINLLCIPFGVANEGGQKRWLKIPLFGTFQPSDFLKIGLIIFMAYYIHKNADVMRKFYYGLFKPGLIMLILVAVMMSQTHLSGLLIMLAVCACMLFVGGVNMKPALIAVGLAAVVVIIGVSLSGADYFGDRIAYMDPLSDPGNKSYQNYQSALAIGSGGFWGKGFGNSSQKYYYLPEAQNDFVYAVLCEEFGFVGGAMVILLFVVFVMRGFYIARKAEDRFGCLIATGITFQIGLQALLNIGVNLCCIPNTGISLPFFSYGGTALMLQLWEMGLLLSVSKRSKLK